LNTDLRALNIAGNEGISLDMALNRLTPQKKEKRKGRTDQSIVLVKFLLAAGFASPKQIEDGLIAVADTGLPLGMVLYARGIVSRTGLNSALAAQRTDQA
jgi:hypothetical protein